MCEHCTAILIIVACHQFYLNSRLSIAKTFYCDTKSCIFILLQYLKYLDQLEAMFERDKEVEEYKKDVRILQSKLKKTRKQVGVNFYYIWYRQPDM